MSDLDPPRQISRPIWIAAAAGAVAIHAGGIALALASMQPDETEQDLGAPAIEIGVELTTPRLDPTGLPVGPDTEASIASPAMVEQEKVVKQTDLPKAAPTETDDPDRVVTLNDTKQPTEDDPRPASQESHASTETVAAEETAMPSHRERGASAALGGARAGNGRKRTPRRGNMAARARRSFQQIQELPGRPLDATRRGDRELRARPHGHMLSTSIVKGSGDPSFDEAALAMLQRADPVPTPPPLVADKGLAFSLPVIFYFKP